MIAWRCSRNQSSDPPPGRWARSSSRKSPSLQTVTSVSANAGACDIAMVVSFYCFGSILVPRRLGLVGAHVRAGRQVLERGPMEVRAVVAIRHEDPSEPSGRHLRALGDSAHAASPS